MWHFSKASAALEVGLLYLGLGAGVMFPCFQTSLEATQSLVHLPRDFWWFLGNLNMAPPGGFPAPTLQMGPANILQRRDGWPQLQVIHSYPNFCCLVLIRCLPYPGKIWGLEMAISHWFHRQATTWVDPTFWPLYGRFLGFQSGDKSKWWYVWLLVTPFLLLKSPFSIGDGKIVVNFLFNM